jgi:hypothetical protein
MQIRQRLAGPNVGERGRVNLLLLVIAAVVVAVVAASLS